jgi:hypothetical protein
MYHVTRPDYDKAYADAIMYAAEKIGLESMHIIPHPKSVGRKYVGTAGRAEWMWETLREADLLVATSIGVGSRASQYPGVIAHYCDEMNELLKPGTRELDITISPKLQRQVFPTKKRIERGFKAAKAITDADTMIFKSDAGTDLTCDISGRRGGCQVSYVDDKDHRWDNFGYDAAYAGPIEDSTNGVLVLDQGDLITSVPGIQYVLDKMKVTYKKGYVTDISGGYSALSYNNHLKRVTKNGEDKEGYGTSHMGWNLSYEATIGAGQRSDLAPYHHSGAGVCMFALGRSHGLDGGATAGFFSTRKAVTHSHFAAFNMDVWLDDLQIMKKGEIIAEGF